MSAAPRFWLENENLWGYKKRQEFMLERIQAFQNSQPNRSLKILDIGCGNGSYITLPLAECGFQILGVDIDNLSVRKAVELNPFSHAEFRSVSTIEDVCSLGKFDVVICSEMLEHLGDPERLLRIIYGVMSPGGLALITVPNGYGPMEWDEYFRKKGWWDRLASLKSRIAGMGRLVRFRKLVIAVCPQLKEAPPENTGWAGEMSSTENVGSSHVQFFRYRAIVRMIERTNLDIVGMHNAFFLGGFVAGRFMWNHQKLLEWNARMANYLPRFMVSGWYFVAMKK